MKVLDTDTLTLLLQGKPKVLDGRKQESEEVVITIVGRMEVLQGRFPSLFKATDGAELIRGQRRLDQAERDLRPFHVLSISEAVAVEFDRLRQVKHLKKIGRADLLIAAIVIAIEPRWSPATRKTSRRFQGSGSRIGRTDSPLRRNKRGQVKFFGDGGATCRYKRTGVLSLT